MTRAALSFESPYEDLILKARERVVVHGDDLVPIERKRCDSLVEGPFCFRLNNQHVPHIVDGLESDLVHDYAYSRGRSAGIRSLEDTVGMVTNENDEELANRAVYEGRLDMRRLFFVRMFPSIFSEGLPKGVDAEWIGRWSTGSTDVNSTMHPTVPVIRLDTVLGAIKFSQPVVVLQLTILRPARHAYGGLFLRGTEGGKQQWRANIHSTVTQPFCTVGDMVEAPFRGNGRPYPCRIASDQGDTFTCDWVDEDVSYRLVEKEQTRKNGVPCHTAPPVPGDRIDVGRSMLPVDRVAFMADAPGWQVAELRVATSGGDVARVVRVTPTSMQVETVSPGAVAYSLNDMMREGYRLRHAMAAETVNFSVNDVVSAHWMGGRVQYPGKISRVNKDGTYNIQYDDGDKEQNVDASLIHRVVSLDESGDVAPLRMRRLPHAKSITGFEMFMEDIPFMPLPDGVTLPALLDDMRALQSALTPKLTSATAKTSESPLSVGDYVQANWQSKGRYYPGKIVKAHGGTFDIDYDDGDKEKEVEAALIDGKLEVGDRIFGNWKKAGRLYRGKIVKVHDTGFVDIDYDDGDQEKLVARPFVYATFAVGDHVQANYKRAGKFFPGVIVGVRSNGQLYDVKYDEGEKEKKVSVHLIRRASTAGKPASKPLKEVTNYVHFDEWFQKKWDETKLEALEVAFEHWRRWTLPPSPLPKAQTFFQVGDVWKGSYFCKTTTSLVLRVKKVDALDFEASFSFKTAAAKGKFQVTGRVDFRGRYVVVEPIKGSFKKQPEKFVAVGLHGFLAQNRSVFRGTVPVMGCDEFFLALSGRHVVAQSQQPILSNASIKVVKTISNALQHLRHFWRAQLVKRAQAKENAPEVGERASGMAGMIQMLLGA